METTSGGSLSEKAPAEYQPGDLLDERYRVLRLLGRGRWATTYLANDEVLDRQFALKLYNVGTPHETPRRELKALFDLDHPNIVSVVDLHRVSTLPHQWMLKMEHLEGEELSAWIGAGRRDPSQIPDALEIGLQLLDALIYLHPDVERASELQSKPELDEADYAELLSIDGLVHRDIKPENVIRSSDGHVTLFDFNIASPSGDRVVTQSHTAGYIPPQADMTRWDPRLDLFAVGVVVFEMLTGCKPFDRHGGVLAIDDPARLNTAIPELIVRFLQRACAAEKDEQFSSADSMRRALATARELMGPDSGGWVELEAHVAWRYDQPTEPAAFTDPDRLQSLIADIVRSSNLGSHRSVAHSRSREATEQELAQGFELGSLQPLRPTQY